MERRVLYVLRSNKEKISAPAWVTCDRARQQEMWLKGFEYGQAAAALGAPSGNIFRGCRNHHLRMKDGPVSRRQT